MSKPRDREPVTLTPLKGRPMLHWVGKKPVARADYYPAQLRESCFTDNPPSDPDFDYFHRDNGENLLLHGDNKEVLSTLLASGFRGKVDLIYIDPPFDSGADYVRRIKLRGGVNGNGNGRNGENGGNGRVSGEGLSYIEQLQYEDIWANDTYLQFMYERLMLLRELLSEKGSIYMHCDENKSHHLRFLMDEVFGAHNFRREIIWDITVLSGYKTQANNWIRGHDSLFYYSKSDSPIFNKLLQPHSEKYLSMFNQRDEKGAYLVAHGVKRYLDDVEKKGKPFGDVWSDIMSFQQQPTAGENVQYPTQKPTTLLERIISASSNKDSIVLDCFAGSGTTAIVAEELGRRWIVADINKGAIQTVMKRLQSTASENDDIVSGGKLRGFAHYAINNYDFQKEKEWRDIIIRRYSVEIDRKDKFFDGLREQKLVKLIEPNRPLSQADIQLIRDEFVKRGEDEREVVVFCNGCEEGARQMAEEAGKLSKINRIEIVDIRDESIYAFSPAQAKVEIKKQGKKAIIRLLDYISPTILERMNIDRTVFDEQLTDFRAQIDCVLVDADHDGKHFNITHSEVPANRKDFVPSEFSISLPRANAKVAVKIIDMLGEETVTVK